MLFFGFPYPPSASVGHPDPTRDVTSAPFVSRPRNPFRDTTGSSETSESSQSSNSLHQAAVWLADPTLQDVPGMELLMRAHIFLHDSSARWKEGSSRQRIVQCLREVENSLCTLSLLHHSSGAGYNVKRCYQSYLHKKRLGRLEKAINVYLDCVDASSFVSPSFPEFDRGNPETITPSDPPAYNPTSSDWNRSELTIFSEDLSSGGNQDQGRDQSHSIDIMSTSSRDSDIAPTMPFKFSPCCEECLVARMPLAWVGSIMNRIKEEGSPYQCLVRDGPSPKSRPNGAPSSSRSRSGRRRSEKTQSEKDSYHHLTRSQSIDSDCQFDDKDSYSEVDALLARRRREQETLYNDSEYMYYMCLYSWM